ncbi:serine hydrolase family protein [Streptomyces sp. 3MP-14]|uniref:Serine hydrolase family protein n=1 Tax=Streptomyces mimosae TaxID=2586635 RepID=A0A5N6AS34_9ACTN|nr:MULTISPECIES: alpha/beta hydrolase [Streptomyces]KAB8170922.1 serine hydrolase family protein [Streptomyces mimosae]KAB8179727.1 serine hydrolase family protein [Streptomyces sp. 3MP-14]
MTPGTTVRRAAIIHGLGASPDDHWFGWLAERLAADGVPTAVPALPDPDAPDPARWAEVLRAEVGVPDAHTVVVAHSLGCLTVLRHLRSLPGPWRLGTLVLVAGFVDRLPALPELDPFIGEGPEVAGLAERVDRLAVLRSDADPLVPAGHTDRLARLLGSSARVVPGAGHFLASDGVISLPEAYEAVAAPRSPDRDADLNAAGAPGS